MDRILDKAIIVACCTASLLFIPFSTLFLVAFLAAVVVGCLGEIGTVPPYIQKIGLVLYLILALFIPEFVAFIPLITYDCLRFSSIVARLIWIVPLASSFRLLEPIAVIFLIIIAFISAVLSRRSLHVEREVVANKSLRDALREESLALERKNQDLQEKQDYEVRLATLNERGRIAREIHDNVGHLLTRSVLQVEAFQVVHAKDEQVKEEFSQVGNTLHEALDTVRMSVHDLHDDSFDLRSQLHEVTQNCAIDEIGLEYDVTSIPLGVGYCFIAVVREALSNTLKHSDACRVTISVIEHPGFFRLGVVDNGTKLSQVTASLRTRGEGIGLRTMEERVRGIGGIFRVDYEKGFRVIVSVPKEVSC